MAVSCACCATPVDWWVRLRSHPDVPICHSCLGGLNAQRDGQLQLMVGSRMVTGFDPIFKVADVTRSVTFYERLGFTASLHDATYGFVHRDRDLTIHLAQAEDGDVPGRGAVYLHCQDAGRVADDWRAAGVAVDGPTDEPWNKREGSVSDPDGNNIRFGSPLR
jgi:hypothetical protein